MIDYFEEGWIVNRPLGVNSLERLTEPCGHRYRCASGMECTRRSASANKKYFHLLVHYNTAQYQSLLN